MRVHLVCAFVLFAGLGLGASSVSAQIADGNFEAGTPWPAWTTQTSTNFGTPLCDVASCGTFPSAMPNSGNNWAWFGGVAAAENATLGQSAVIPVGTTTLRFRSFWGAVVGPFSSTLTISIDGTTIGTMPEPAVAQTAYGIRNFAIPGAFADGNAHNILFSYVQTTPQVINLSVDDVTLVAPGTIDIQTTTIPDAVEQIAYSTGITATETGTSNPYTWSLTGAPGWLTISGVTLTPTLSGTPPAGSAGTITFDITVTAVAMETDTQTVSLTILPSGTLAISTTSMPMGFTNLAYSGTISCAGGTGPYTWSVVSGNLPPGLALDASPTNTVGFTGTPTTTGTSNFTIQVEDSTMATATRPMSIGITVGNGGAVTSPGGGGGGCAVQLGRTSTLAVMLMLGALGGAVLLRRRFA